ncbi:MAG: site-2 protease family protein [Candidatus Absconditabacteria bacterium]
MQIIGIILVVLFFIVLILIHELGHFIAAKKSGVKVEEFGLGIPPKVCTLYTDKSGTNYTLNAIPLGGFVKLKGEDPSTTGEFYAKDSMMGQPLWKRLIILSGGVVMNLILGFVIFVGCFMYGVEPIVVIPDNSIAIESDSYFFPSYSFAQKEGILERQGEDKKLLINEVMQGSLAEKGGLLSGDKILTINSKEVSSNNVSESLFALSGKSFPLTYERDGVENEINIQCPEDNCLLGIAYSGTNNKINPVKFGFFQSFGAAAHEIKAQTNISFYALGTIGKGLFSFDKEKINQSVEKLSGPVGAGKIWHMIYQNSFVQFIAFGGLISIALAIFNFLPIPALDGGRAASMIIQKVFALNPDKYFKVEEYINLVFFVLLMAFGIFIIYKDIVRFYI